MHDALAQSASAIEGGFAEVGDNGLTVLAEKVEG